MTPRVLLENLLGGDDLSVSEGEGLLGVLTDPDVADAVKGALLAALRAKGETAEELRGMAQAMRDAARPLPFSVEGPLVDTCGTGGDGSHSINISTAASLVVAALGYRVVKHGNRSVSSKAGSADVLEAMGIRLPEDPEQAARRLHDHGWTFLFAPVFHPAMKAVVPVRRAMKVRTAFNMLGPLTNPARPGIQLLGAFSVEAAQIMAHALSGLGVERAFVVHGFPHWDEATPMGPFVRFDVRAGTVRREEVDPLTYDIPRCDEADLAGGDALENASALNAIFSGAPGAGRAAVTLNAALVLELLGIPKTEAVSRVRQALDDGTVASFVEQLAR